jgi:glycosyltransferase involved in cell wall biosynthesis
MKFDKIYILTDAPIPIGFAPTNRILSYATGFKKNGVECEIVIFRKTSQKQNKQQQGYYNGIRYRYLFSNPIKSKYFVIRRFDNLFVLFRLLFFSLRNLKKHDVIIYYSAYTRYILILNAVKKIKGYLLLKEESEHPNVRKKSKNRMSWFFFHYVHYKFFDGILLMTNTLIKYFEVKYPKLKSIHIPMTVDLERFCEVDKRDNYIIYVGSLSNKKDGILNFLQAYKLSLVKDFWSLLICGFYSSVKEREEFEKYIVNFGLNKSVEYKYNVERSEIPNLLMKSKLAILPRPNSTQAQNGFPTKLGEYLASSTPTMVTAVGEIPNYLEDNLNSFIVHSGEISEMKKKLDFIYNNYNKAVEIGKKGRKVAEIFFNNAIQTKKIIDFIYKL